MNTATDDDQIEVHADFVVDALALRFITLAAAIGDLAVSRQPRDFRQRIRQSVDHDGATIHVQTSVPSGDVTVFADGPGWAQPITLLALAPTEADVLPDFAKLATAIVDQAMLTVAPGARRNLLAALDSDEASLAIIADLPACEVRVLVHAEGWTGPEEVLRIVPPAMRTDFDA
jgi:hypothetical protein